MVIIHILIILINNVLRMYALTIIFITSNKYINSLNGDNLLIDVIHKLLAIFSFFVMYSSLNHWMVMKIDDYNQYMTWQERPILHSTKNIQ